MVRVQLRNNKLFCTGKNTFNGLADLWYTKFLVSAHLLRIVLSWNELIVIAKYSVTMKKINNNAYGKIAIKRCYN